MADRRVGGIIFFKVDGELFQAKGAFSYNLGQPKREAIVGQEATHGYKETPQVAMIEGSITDAANLDLEKFVNITDAVVTLELANGKIIVLRDAWYAADGSVTSDEGEIETRFEGLQAEEVQ